MFCVCLLVFRCFWAIRAGRREAGLLRQLHEPGHHERVGLRGGADAGEPEGTEGRVGEGCSVRLSLSGILLGAGSGGVLDVRLSRGVGVSGGHLSAAHFR